MDFNYMDNYSGPILDAYKKLSWNACRVTRRCSGDRMRWNYPGPLWTRFWKLARRAQTEVCGFFPMKPGRGAPRPPGRGSNDRGLELVSKSASFWKSFRGGRTKRASPDPSPKPLMILHHCRSWRQWCRRRNSDISFTPRGSETIYNTVCFTPGCLVERLLPISVPVWTGRNNGSRGNEVFGAHHYGRVACRERCPFPFGVVIHPRRDRAIAVRVDSSRRGAVRAAVGPG